MKKSAITLLLFCAAGILFAGGDKRNKLDIPAPVLTESLELSGEYTGAPVQIDWSLMSPPLIGTYTTLTGFYDYQSNGGSIHHIRVNPANGNIHVTYMLADDSTATTLNNARRTAYAFSSNGGVTWNNFGNARIPNRRSGFPSIDLLKGPNAGMPVIANHASVATPVQTLVYVDAPEGTGAFAELNASPFGWAGSDEPIWPYVAGRADGNITISASRNTAGTNWYIQMTDFANWSPSWTSFPGVNQSGGRYPVASNDNGRVGILVNTSNGSANRGNFWLESTDNGTTWPTTATTIYPPFRWDGPDSVVSYVHADVMYHGNNPLFVFSEFSANTTISEPRISFWSDATGWKTIVPWDPTKYISALGLDQRFHSLPLGWPTIGLSGNNIAVAFQAFQPELDTRGYNYSDIWFVESNNLGATWSTPVNLTNTPNQDERYPSVSKWNAPGQANILWTLKNKSGLYAFPGDADTVRTWQVFHRRTLTSIGDEPGLVQSFNLSQNYPNPFNPSTKITYALPVASHVNLSVYNVLGQKVATIVDERRDAGTYETGFAGNGLTSGVYFYTLRAGSFASTKKMVLLK